MLTSIRAALAITLAVLPGMGFAQVKADEPKWVEFQGEYRNLAGYAYHVVVPPGFTGHEAPAPAPAHGFGVDLESAANAYIWVDGSYNVVVYPSAHSATQEHLKWFKEEHTVIGRPVLRQSK